jgi:thymidylate synthase (FAD)
MQVIDPSYEIMYYDKDALKLLEKIARVCYKSEDKITEYSHESLLKNLITRDHTAMIEHSNVTVKFVHNRGFSHELVRHRIASYAQESTRYCNYSKGKFDGELTMIKPYWFEENDDIDCIIWHDTMKKIEQSYMELIKMGQPPQAARGILPNDLKTEIVITANLREWRNIFKLRTAIAAHPDMRRIMVPLFFDLRGIFPIIFNDIKMEI